MADLISGAVVGAVVGELLHAVLEAKDKALMFRSILEHMEDTLRSIIPIINNIEELDRRLDRRKEETGRLMKIIKEGKDLLLECSKIRWYHSWKKPKYTDKLVELEASLRSFFDIDVQAQLARDTREILLLARNERCLNCVDGFNALCAVPEAPINPVGLEVALEELKVELFQDEVTMVVLSAPPGCGKTTLAKLLCHDKQVEEKFKDNIFYVIVSKNTTMEGIVRRIFKHKGHNAGDFHSDEDMVYRLGQFFKNIGPDPIMLVLDDVWPDSESLLEKLKFQIKDYKILVTSRSVFPRFGSTYNLQPLSYEDSMTLFRESAFLPDGSSYKPDEDIVKKIVERLKGFPLAISVVGKSLRGKPAAEWRKRLKEYCSKPASILSEEELLKCLESSVDALDDKVVAKECYMDLASFPRDQMIPVTILIDMWVELHNVDEDTAIANLYELFYRNLVDLVVTRKEASEDDGTYNEHFVVQHGLLRELAMRQSNLECIEKRKRLFIDISGNKLPEWWNEQMQPFISTKLLSISTDETFSSNWCSMQAAEVEVLVLNFQTMNHTLPEFMERMDKLKVLIVTNYGLYPAELSNCPLVGSLSNLKRIRLEKVSIPSSFLKDVQLKKLEKMSLVMCNIGQAFGNSDIKISDAFPNLVEIEIDYCNDLVELPAGICDLVFLNKLSITNCPKLSALPKQIGKLLKLEVLRLNSCIELPGLPDTIGGLRELWILDLSECLSITELPVEIGDLYNLRKLYMIDCSSCELPSSIINLVHLKEVIGDEETAGAWKDFKPFLPSLTIKVHKEINLNWLR